MNEPLRLLAAMAHPHDWTWVSGTLCLHARAGDRVTVCSVTHGGATHRERFLDEMARPEAERDPAIVGEPVEAYTGRKEREMRQAAALFGIEDVRVLGFDDKPFTRQEQPQAIDAIRELIVEVAPDVLITENPYGDSGFRMAHRTDHTEVGRAVLEARDRAATPRDGRPHRVAVTYFSGIMFDTSQVTCGVELSDEIVELRVQAEACYRTQEHDPERARRRIEMELAHLGRVMRTRYAETFVQESPSLLGRLAVPERMLASSREGRVQRIRRLM